MDTLAIIVPAFNEAKAIEKTLESILEVCNDIVVIDDGSMDNTAEIVKRYPVTLIQNGKNRGLAQTVKVGLQYVLDQGYDYALKMDADGQMNASMIPTIKQVIKDSDTKDIIYCTYDEKTPWMIRKDMKIYSTIYELGTSIKTSDLLSEFRAYSKKAMKFLVERTTNEGYGSPLILMDMHREGMESLEVKGGVSYAENVIRPFPLDAQLGLRKSFVSKLYKFPGIRSKIVSIGSIPFWAALLMFNVTVQPKYHSILPKKYMRPGK